MLKRLEYILIALFIASFGFAQSNEAEKFEAEGYARLDEKDYEGARELFKKMIEIAPGNGWGYYNMACTYGREGKPDSTLIWLANAFKHGFKQFSHALYYDSDLESVRDLPEFKKIIFDAIERHRESLLEYAKRHPQKKADIYWEIAKTYSATKEIDKGLEYVDKAIRSGLSNFSWRGLEELRKDERFDEIVSKAIRWKGTPQEKIWGLMQVYSEVKYNFANFENVPGLDWDKLVKEYIPKVMSARNEQEYYKLLQKLIANLKDNHTYITLPDELRDGLDMPPIEVEVIENKFIITRVDDTEEMKRNNIYPGLEIKEVDGVAVKKYFEKNKLPYLALSQTQRERLANVSSLLKGKKDSHVKLTICDLNGKKRKVILTRNSLLDKGNKFLWSTRVDSPLVEVKEVDEGIFYFNLHSFGSDRTAILFEKELSELDLKEVKGIILDVRYNTGGNSSVGDRITSCLIEKPIKRHAIFRARNYRPLYRLWGREQEWHEIDTPPVTPSSGEHYLGPVVVLVSRYTGSAAEDFLVPLKYNKRAVLVGETTAGGTGNGLNTILPGGGMLRVCINTEKYVGCGISPDIEVYSTQDDIYKGYDRVLAKAIEVIKENKD
ncbi:MAG: S41 family peptidase [bacterium]|nr:S41 family peptidase [bacterium]